MLSVSVSLSNVSNVQWLGWWVGFMLNSIKSYQFKFRASRRMFNFLSPFKRSAGWRFVADEHDVLVAKHQISS